MTSSWRSAQTGVIDIRFMLARERAESWQGYGRWIDRDLRGVEGADGQPVELRVEVDHLVPFRLARPVRPCLRRRAVRGGVPCAS